MWDMLPCTPSHQNFRLRIYLLKSYVAALALGVNAMATEKGAKSIAPLKIS